MGHKKVYPAWDGGGGGAKSFGSAIFPFCSPPSLPVIYNQSLKLMCRCLFVFRTGIEPEKCKIVLPRIFLCASYMCTTECLILSRHPCLPCRIFRNLLEIDKRRQSVIRTSLLTCLYSVRSRSKHKTNFMGTMNLKRFLFHLYLF